MSKKVLTKQEHFEENLSQEAEKIRKKLRVLDEKIAKKKEKEDREEAIKLIGNCYKFPNSFGSGQDFTQYRKVVGVGKNGWIHTVDFYINPYDNRHQIERYIVYSLHNLERHKQITQAEYDKNLAKLMKKMFESA